MRLVFCGTATFAVPSLLALAVEHDVAAVVTQPARPGSRGTPAPRPVADAAATLGTLLLQPERIRSEAAVSEILGLAPDVLVVAAYGQIIPAALLEGPRHGGVNVHASLLPRWRGAAPVAAAIAAGDAVTGVSIMRMDAGLDTGPVYARREESVAPSDTTPSLTDRLAQRGADLLVQVLRAIAAGAAQATAQDDSQATHAPRMRREDGDVRWESVTAARLDRLVRALQPWPGVRVPIGGSAVRLLDGVPVTDSGVVGEPGSTRPGPADSLDVATAAGSYRVRTVQPPGRGAMSAQAYLRGRR